MDDTGKNIAAIASNGQIYTNNNFGNGSWNNPIDIGTAGTSITSNGAGTIMAALGLDTYIYTSFNPTYLLSVNGNIDISGNIISNGSVTTSNGVILAGTTLNGNLVTGSSISSNGNIVASGSITAPTFNGNLLGNASTANYATSAGSANSATYASQSPGDFTVGGSLSIKNANVGDFPTGIYFGIIASESAGGGPVIHSNPSNQLIFQGVSGVNIPPPGSGPYPLSIASDSSISTATSIRRLKKNITPLPANYNLDMLMNMEPIVYNGIDSHSDIPNIAGFIAEDFDDIGAKLFLMVDNSNALTGIIYDRITSFLVRCAQLQQVQIKDQQTQIDELQTQAASMQSQMQLLLDKLV